MITATSTPTVRYFKPSDLDELVNRDGYQIPKSVLLMQANAGPSFTAVADGAVLGCAGLVMPWPGIGMTWMVLAEEIGPHGLWLTRTVNTFLQQMVETHGLHRLEAVALSGSMRNQEWLRALGFHVELHGEARYFLSDQRSVIRYEWVKD